MRSGTAADDFSLQQHVSLATHDAVRSVFEYEWENVFEIYFERLGRTYYIKASSPDECDSWIKDIQKTKEAAVAEIEKGLNLSVRIKLSVAAFYDHQITQASIGLLLLVNFCITIIQIEMESSPRHDINEKLFIAINHAFTAIYTVELMVNMYGHWAWPFFSSGW